jgi:hypothetical protein
MSLQAEIKELQARVAELKSGIPTMKFGGLTVKIGEKGGLVIYGLSKFPVNLYLNQATKISELFSSKELAEFVEANSDKFSEKPVKA